MISPLVWNNGHITLIDQRKLPHTEEYFKVVDFNSCHDAIKLMVVRGAPLIGFTALWGGVISLKNNEDMSLNEFEEICSYIKSARPTAVNLEFELNRLFLMAKEYYSKNSSLTGFYDIALEHTLLQQENLFHFNTKMAQIGLEELREKIDKKKFRLMTICNTGALACGPIGTALGVIVHAHQEGAVEFVYASETRPYLQGSRLTSYELTENKIDHQIVVEGAFSYLMRNKLVDAIFVGADRIALNGDTANKIGTSTLSIVARFYNIPFYVVAPTSSFDQFVSSGDDINIELRNSKEILEFNGSRVAPIKASALNPSFDITSAKCISGIICEKGMISPVTADNLLKVLNG